MKIAVVGSYGAGLTMRVPRAPVAGETLTGGVFASGHGGKGSNQAVGAARLGAEVAFLTAIGRDQFGAAARRLWADEGVDAAQVRDTDAATMVGFILVDHEGENRIVIAPGALDELTPADVERPFAGRIAEADMVVVSPGDPAAGRRRPRCGSPANTAPHAAQHPAPAAPLPDEAWDWIDVLTPERQRGAGAHRGRPRDEPSSPDELPTCCAGPFAGTIVLTLGAEGAHRRPGRRSVTGGAGPRSRTSSTPPAPVTPFTGALAVALSAATRSRRRPLRRRRRRPHRRHPRGRPGAAPSGRCRGPAEEMTPMTTTTATDGAAGGGDRRGLRPQPPAAFLHAREASTFLALVVLFALGTLIAPGFLGTANFLTVGQQIAQIGIMAVGMTFVIINAEIDLSVGSIYGLGADLLRAADQSYRYVTWPLAALGGIAGRRRRPASSTALYDGRLRHPVLHRHARHPQRLPGCGAAAQRRRAGLAVLGHPNVASSACWARASSSACCRCS